MNAWEHGKHTKNIEKGIIPTAVVGSQGPPGPPWGPWGLLKAVGRLLKDSDKKKLKDSGKKLKDSGKN